jgi:hypothetical protein
LRVPTSREAITTDLQRAGPGQTLVYEVGFPSGGASQPRLVTVVAANTATVSDQPLPNPLDSRNPLADLAESHRQRTTGSYSIIRDMGGQAVRMLVQRLTEWVA